MLQSEDRMILCMLQFYPSKTYPKLMFVAQAPNFKKDQMLSSNKTKGIFTSKFKESADLIHSHLPKSLPKLFLAASHVSGTSVALSLSLQRFRSGLFGNGLCFATPSSTQRDLGKTSERLPAERGGGGVVFFMFSTSPGRC